MRIENDDMHYFIAHFTEKEKLTGITKVLKEKLPPHSFSVSEDESDFHIANMKRETFNRIINNHFQNKQLSLF